MDWVREHGLLGKRVTVWLVVAVALLSLVTGVANITAETVLDPLASVVPAWAQRTAGFTGALTGFLMLASAFGLRRGLRVAWYSTMLLLPVTAVQGLAQASELSVPLVVLSVLAMPVVLANRRRFDRELPLSTAQAGAASALVGGQLYGTIGAYALREEFEGVRTMLDAFYFAIVTASTVGYGDVTATTQAAKLFAVSVVVVGTASFAVALGAVLGPAIQARFTAALGRMTDSELELLEDHVVVLGHGELTESILTELDGRVAFVVVTPDSGRADELADRGYDVVVADPSDEEPLRRVGIADARAVVAAIDDDAQDALAVLTARQLLPEGRIVAAASDQENVAKLKRAGADAVISPASIGGHLLVQSALGEDDTEEFAERLLSESRDQAR